MKIEIRCRYMNGEVPCLPHKEHGVHCDNCVYKDITKGDILIIKLGAIGDVIRTTPLLYRLKKEYPKAKIWWLTRTPEILPNIVDIKLPFTFESSMIISETAFDIAYNFDKDKEACALLNKIKAKKKYGYKLFNGICYPANTKAQQKFESGLFDDVSKANKKSYMEEIFEIAGYKFMGEEYILPFNQYDNPKWKFAKGKKVVGLNTGCGGRWTSRLWPDKHWIELARNLKKSGYDVILLGGKQEHEKNKYLAKMAGVKYFGFYPLNEFINLINRCNLVVTAVTMAMHITIALKKKIVLFNNIFNKNEYYLYGLGEILEPDIECDCYFSTTCANNCMQYLKPERVFQTVKKLLPLR